LIRFVYIAVFGPYWFHIARRYWSNTIQTFRYLVIKGLLLLTARLPLRLIHVLGAGLGWLNYVLPSRARKTTLANLLLCFPDHTMRQRNRLAQDSLISTACTALEMGKAWFVPIEQTLDMVKEIEGQAIMEAALAQGKGIIVLTPHVGNWEMFGQFLSFHFQGSAFLYQPPKIEKLGADIKAARSRGGLEMVPTSPTGVGKLLKRLNRNGIVGILPDQEPPEEAGLFAPFFDVPALTMTLVSKLIERTGASVVCGYALRLPDSAGFKIVFKNVDPFVHDECLEKSVQGLNRTVQSCAEEACEQYQWEYKRFKRRPDGSRFYD